jgi:putative transcriptional regulator
LAIPIDRPAKRTTKKPTNSGIAAQYKVPRMTSMLDIRPGGFYSAMESLLYMGAEIENRVKELRTARGWTQEQLADAVGVSRQSINSIERERYVPSLELALLFARVFGCATDEIFQLKRGAK